MSDLSAPPSSATAARTPSSEPDTAPVSPTTAPKKRGGLRGSLTLTALAATNAIMGLLYLILVTRYFGKGWQTDAFSAARRVPDFISGLCLSAMGGVLVPVFATLKGKEVLRAEGWRFIRTIGAYLGGLCLFLEVTAGLWVPHLFPGYKPEAQALTVLCTRFQLLSMFLTLIFTIIAAVYQAQRRFIIVEATLLIGNLLGIGALMWALPRYGIVAATVILAIEWALQVLILLPGLGMPRMLTGSAADTLHAEERDALTTAWRRVRPLLLGGAYYKTDTVVESFLASFTPEGSFTVYNLGQQFYSSGQMAFSKAAATPITPVLARQAEEGNWSGFAHTTFGRLWKVMALSVLIFALVAAIGQPVLDVLLKHGLFGGKDVHQLWGLMLALGGLWLGGVGGQITSNSFYAKGDTGFPTKLGIVTYTIYIPLKIWAAMRFGIYGIAYSTSLFSLVNFFGQGIVMWYSLRRKVSPAL